MKPFTFVGRVLREETATGGKGEMRGSLTFVAEKDGAGAPEQKFYFKSFDEMAAFLQKHYETLSES